VQRDRRTWSADKLRESSTVVGLSQSRLREQVEGLLTRMNSQLVQRDPAFAKIAEMLPQAVEAMKEAETSLAAVKPEGALPPEHKALQILQKAEEEYEQQISVQRGGGGGGGGGSAQAQELAEIFEQELQKMANRYETANQAQQQSGDRQVDELLEKLRELARRQEQEAARQRLRALEQGGGSSSGSSAAQQRALAEQAEEAARRLERLAREENRPDLQDAARQLQQAADAMRRAAAGGDQGAAGQAAQALERLRETERRLQQQQQGRAERDIRDAQRQAEEIQRQQQEIADDVRTLANAPTNANRREQARGINEQKNELEARLNQLEQQLDRAARDASATERGASRKMAEAAGSIRDNRLADKIRYSQNLVNRGAAPGVYNAAENEIAGGIEELRKRLDEAAGALGEGNQNANRMENALERARRLARAAESMQQRTAERGQQGQQGQAERGQNGQDGDRGEQQGNRQGENAQNQGGQQGQRGQGQGQGQQGQQGQGGSEGQGGNDGQAGQGQMANGRAGGNGTWGGAINNGGGYGYGWEYGRNWRLTPEDIRQLRGEARQWTGEALELRRDLQAENVDPRDLDEILRALRQLDDPRVYQNAQELSRLQSVVAEGLKRFEFGLRRQADANQNAVVLSGSDDVPEDFRKLVEQYFRSLGKGTTAR
jgi:DNA repair exonuclease SbcCD ATPase subunit